MILSKLFSVIICFITISSFFITENLVSASEFTNILLSTESSKVVSNNYLIKLRTNDVERISKNLGVKSIKKVKNNTYEVSLDDNNKMLSKSQLNNITSINTEIEYIEPNFIVEIQNLPNDPKFNEQWGLENSNNSRDINQSINAARAWEYSKGSKLVKIAVIDSGIDINHQDLKNKILKDDLGKIIGHNTINDNKNVIDDNNHGTIVSGVIASEYNNGIGISGTCPRCLIMPIKAIQSNGTGTISDIAEGIYFAVDNGAHVINLSLGTTEKSYTMKEAVDYALQNGVAVVASAGNKASSTRSYPAAFRGVIAVSAYDENGNLAYFSNRGNWVDVSAPGVNIISTTPGNNYSRFNGTSISAAFVSGAVGLAFASKIDKKGNEIIMSRYRGHQMEKAIRFQGINKTSFTNAGKGKINAYKLVRAPMFSSLSIYPFKGIKQTDPIFKWPMWNRDGKENFTVYHLFILDENETILYKRSVWSSTEKCYYINRLDNGCTTNVLFTFKFEPQKIYKWYVQAENTTYSEKTNIQTFKIK